MKNNKKSRRKFLQTGATGVVAALFGNLPIMSFAQSTSDENRGIVVPEDGGLHIITRRKVPITLKVSKQQHGITNISFCSEEMSPGRKMRVHKHLHNDEFIFVHQGEGTLPLREQLVAVKTGAVIFVPRGVWQGLDNTGQENLLMVFGYSPAGFEAYFLENGTAVSTPVKARTEQEHAITEKKYGMIYR